MTGFKWFLVIVVIGYGGLLALMYVFQRKLMYFPDATRTPPAQAGLPQAEEVRLTSSDGEKLIAWHVAPRAEKPVVTLFPGQWRRPRPARRPLPLADRRRHRAVSAQLPRLWRLERQPE